MSSSRTEKMQSKWQIGIQNNLEFIIPFLLYYSLLLSMVQDRPLVQFPLKKIKIKVLINPCSQEINSQIVSQPKNKNTNYLHFSSLGVCPVLCENIL